MGKPEKNVVIDAFDRFNTEMESKSPLTIVVICVTIVIIIIGIVLWSYIITYIGFEKETNCDHGYIGPIFYVKDAENQKIDDVMFYIRHTGGNPINLSGYKLKAGLEDDLCQIDFKTDIRNMTGIYESDWNNETHVISVNERVYFTPACLTGLMEDGGTLVFRISCAKCDKVLFEDQCTIYDA